MHEEDDSAMEVAGPSGSETDLMLGGNAEEFFSGMLGSDAGDLMSGFMNESHQAYEWKDMPVFVQGLGSENKEVRDTAMEALLYFGDAAVPDIVKLLRTGSTTARLGAAHVLAQMGYDAREALPDLVHLLDSDDWLLRRFACQALGNLHTPDYVWTWREEPIGGANEDIAPKPLAWAAVPGLIERLNDTESLVRLEAVRALKAIAEEARELQYPGLNAGEYLEPVLPLLNDSDPEVCHAAAKTVGLFGAEAEHALDSVLALLESPSGTVRETAAQALGDIGHVSPKISAGLARLLNDPESSVRVAVLKALPVVMRKDRDLIDSMMKSLVDPAPEVRAAAADSLSELGPHGSQAVTLVKYLVALLQRDPSAEVRTAAAAGLGRMVQYARGVEPVLERAMDDPAGSVRGAATYARARFGVTDRRLAGRMVRLLNNRGQEELAGNSRAVGLLKPPDKQGIRNLLNILERESTEEPVRKAVAQALADIGEPALEMMVDQMGRDPLNAYYYQEVFDAMGEKSVSALASMLYHNDMYVRMSAAVALGRLGERAAPAIPELAKAARSSNYSDVAAAVTAMIAIGKPARQTLVGLCESQFPIARSAGIGALVAMDVPVEQSLPILTRALEDKSPTIRVGAITSLGMMKDEAKPAVQALTKRLDDPDPFVRMFVPDALVSVDPESPEIAVALGEAVKNMRDDYTTQINAMDALEEMGKFSAPAAPTLIQAFPKAEPDMKRRILYLLGEVGWEARKGLPYMVEVLRSSTHPPLLIASARGVSGIASGYRAFGEQIAYEPFKEAVDSLTVAYNLIQDNPETQRRTRREQTRLQQDLPILQGMVRQKYEALPMTAKLNIWYQNSNYRKHQTKMLVWGTLFLLGGGIWGAKVLVARHRNAQLA